MHKPLSNTLIAEHLPLEGQHLIEASAGTGKTFNITRIYLRLLLEKKLTVQQILVMTFTKDATEELRGRIENFIRQALTHWQVLELEDTYFQTLSTRVPASERLLLLNRALVNIDEAAIFTIHSFCKRVLNQHAFLSGVSFSAQMEVDSQEYVIEICRDWYRQLANKSPDKYMTIAEYWSTPEKLIRQFNKAINHYCQLDIINEDNIKQRFFTQVKEALNTIESNVSLLTTHLIDCKKGAEKDKRQTELNNLILWLNNALNDFTVTETNFPGEFLDGRRLPRTEIKVDLSAALLPAINLKKAITSIVKAVKKAKALVIIQTGIYSMREQLKQLKQEKNILTFDDLITTLATQLKQPEEGFDGSNANSLLASALLKQFPAALVDEFQDTDPLQFDILSAIYQNQTDSSLFMIGDPKQAIYGFRGGDVFAYLNARAKCDQQWVMDTNWRSSKNMITGYNRLFYGNHLTESSRDVFGYNIAYHPVKASPKADDKQLVDLSFNALQFVHFESEGKRAPASYRQQLARWCANEITRLIYNEKDSLRQIQAKDIAILVRDGTEAADIRTALNEANLACVYLSNRANLWQSEQSKQVLLVLKGICHAEDNHQFLASLTSPLLGIDINTYVELLDDDIQWQALAERFIKLRALWRSHGFITMALKLLHDLFTFKPQQERELTNVLHLFELLQSVSQRHQQPEELVHWFEQQISQDFTEIEAELRLESEEDLVKIITQHGAKGLEYPIVFVPFATRHKDPLKVAQTNVELIEYHQKDGGLTLSLDGSQEAKQAMCNEQYAESIRLLYVAVTRAEQRCYILTTNFDKSELSPLGQTLDWQADQNIPESLTQLVNDNPESIGLNIIKDEMLPLSIAPNNVETLDINIVQFTGKIERNWWLSSFTALSRNLRDVGVSSPDRDLFEKNSLSDEIYNAAELRFDLAKGAKTGNLLHDILEFVNFSHPNWQAAISAPLMRFGNLGNGYQETELVEWLNEVIKTPLTINPKTIGLIDANENECNLLSFSLADLNHSQTLREAEFYFPLEAASTKDLTSILSQHRLRVNNHFKSGHSIGLPSQVLLPNIATLQGMMHGFIDLIFEHNGKYYLCDYKSNHLGNNYADYSPEKLAQSIQAHHYDLQYLIYSVALHRFLQQKLPDYHIDEHFGGVYYLYLRGMSPNSRNTGVYFCQLSHDELTQLDNVFSNGESPKILVNETKGVK